MPTTVKCPHCNAELDAKTGVAMVQGPNFSLGSHHSAVFLVTCSKRNAILGSVLPW